MNKTVFLIRHGETNSRDLKIFQSDDLEINCEGRKNATNIASQLKYQNIKKIISSPLKRAKQTATIIGDEIKAPIEEADLLVEISNPPMIRGKKWNNKAADKAYRNWLKGLELPHSLGSKYEENYFDLHARTSKILEYLVENEQDNIALVSHSILIKGLVARVVVGSEYAQCFADIITSIKIKNCAVVKLSLVSGRWTIHI